MSKIEINLEDIILRIEPVKGTGSQHRVHQQ